MRRRTMVLIAVAAVAMTTAAPPARAGGWWTSIRLDARHLGIGETLTVTAEPSFDSVPAARRARASGGYYAYLLRGVDKAMVRRALSRAEPGDWWTPPPGGIVAGRVELGALDANLATATSTVTVPEVDPGRYSLMLCTYECSAPLANVLPAPVRVSPDPALAARARALTTRKSHLMQTAAALRRRLKVSHRRGDGHAQQLAAARRQIQELNERVDELEALAGGGESGAGTGGGESGAGTGGGGGGAALAAAFLLGAVAGGLAAGRSRRARLRGGRGVRSPGAASGGPAAARR